MWSRISRFDGRSLGWYRESIPTCFAALRLAVKYSVSKRSYISCAAMRAICSRTRGSAMRERCADMKPVRCGAGLWSEVSLLEHSRSTAKLCQRLSTIATVTLEPNYNAYTRLKFLLSEVSTAYRPHVCDNFKDFVSANNGLMFATHRASNRAVLFCV